MKTIGIDLRCLPDRGECGAGIAHAAKALVNELVKSEKFNWKIFIRKQSEWEGDCFKLETYSARELDRELLKAKCDLLFEPTGAVPLQIKIPTIPWVHDLIIFDHPEWFPQNWFKRQMTTKIFLTGLKKSPVVFTVSEYTKKSIMRIAQISDEKIFVTGEGGDDELSKISENDLASTKLKALEFCKKRFGLKRPFMLVLGTVEPRKNFDFLFNIWKTARQSNLQIADLVIAGSNGWKMEKINKEINSDRFHKEFLHRLYPTDEEKRMLQLGALFLLVPSLDEGFGLPALESMQAGTMIIASNAGALPEVVQNGGILLNPKDEKEWLSTMLVYCKDERARKLFSRKAKQRSKEFSWKKSAERVLEYLE